MPDTDRPYIEWDKKELVKLIEQLKEAVVSIQAGDASTAGTIYVEGLVSQRNHRPYVVLSVDAKRHQLTVPKAREIAHMLNRASVNVEYDAFIFDFFAKEMDLEYPVVASMIARFRDFVKENTQQQVKEDLA